VVPILSVGTTRAVAWFHLGETPSAGQILQGAVVLLAPATVVVFLTSLSVLLGLLLLVIPGIYVLIRLQFAASALALDGQRGTYALRRSWQLVRGNFWRVLGITLLALLLGNLASGILSLPFVLPTLNGGSGVWWIRGIGLAIGPLVATPFTQIVTVLLYLDLRVRKEGLTLDRLHSEAGSTP
jgi:hypothetical protein